MSNPDSPQFIPETAVEETREEFVERKMNKNDLLAYKEWKQKIPFDLRSLVEGRLADKKTRISTDDMPSVQEFYRGMRDLLSDPTADITSLGVSEIVQKQLSALQHLKFGEQEEVNLFAAFSDPDIGFDVKTNYVNSKLLPRLEFLRSRDKQQIQKAIEEKGQTEVSGEDEDEEYSPHRAPEQESEGMPSEAVATITPFYGGYVMDSVYDVYDPNTLTWKKSPRRFQELQEQKLDEKRLRVYCSRAKLGRGAVKLPSGWGADKKSVKWIGTEPASWSLIHDQDGVVSVRAESEEPIQFSVDIAPSQDAIRLAVPEGDIEPVSDKFPDELISSVQEIMEKQIPISVKVRRIASLIHNHLEYDKDPKWEEVYKADPSRYFEEIWQNKKAKCDEANSLLVRLLTKFGVHARFIGGHSVRTKSENGEALLLESNRHAWSYAWDSENKEWIRLDATPAGDPNVDQEQQEEELGEGDYGEQEAELMSDEELEKRLEEIEKEELEQKTENDPILNYAKEAECSPEEARSVLDKIDKLRRKHARVLIDADRQWRTLIRENTREKIVDRGPVPLSKMDAMDEDEMVSGYVEILAGEKDPLIGQREESEPKKEKWFGGYEVYIAVDLSDSMNKTVNGVKKVDAQRDMVFLLVDSCMSAAVNAKRKEHQLKAPMPVKVTVVVFGAKTEIVLPLTETWGPKEQIKLYRALDAGAGGGTPDDVGLSLLESQINGSLHDQDEARRKNPKLQKNGWKMRRFVLATADGGSDDSWAVKQVNDRLKLQGVPVDLFLIAPEDDENLKTAAKAAYQSVTPISDVGGLAQKGLARLTERIREAYGMK